MDEMIIRVLASMRTSWARDAQALRSIGRCLEDVEDTPGTSPLPQVSWQGTKLLDACQGVETGTQMLTEVIAALNRPVEVRGDSIHSDATSDWDDTSWRTEHSH